MSFFMMQLMSDFHFYFRFDVERRSEYISVRRIAYALVV